jgi:hypothetical protein
MVLYVSFYASLSLYIYISLSRPKEPIQSKVILFSCFVIGLFFNQEDDVHFSLCLLDLAVFLFFFGCLK